jgi:hypothetical protein
MSLPTVFDTCEPREDVLKGTIADADFAADLAKVIRGIASDDYQNRSSRQPSVSASLNFRLRAFAAWTCISPRSAPRWRSFPNTGP